MAAQEAYLCFSSSEMRYPNPLSRYSATRESSVRSRIFRRRPNGLFDLEYNSACPASRFGPVQPSDRNQPNNCNKPQEEPSAEPRSIGAIAISRRTYKYDNRA